MSEPLPSIKLKAAELLLRAHTLSRAQYERVVTLVEETGERSEEVMIEHSILSEADLLKAL